MSFRPYKFLVVPVIQEVDEDGDVIQEMSAGAADHTCSASRDCASFADTFEMTLAASVNGGNPNAR